MPHVIAARRLAACASAAFLLSACSGGATLASRAAARAAAIQNAARGTDSAIPSVPDASGKIKHVVVIVQENRSFDNLFQGFPGADTRSWGYNSHGTKVDLQPISLATSFDIDHSASSFFVAYDNGKMDGFDAEPVYGIGPPPHNPQYAYVPHSESKPYFDMAQQYVLADRMFTSHIDESFVSHQYIIAGQSSTAVNLPNSTWGCDGGPSDTIQTLNPDRTYGNRVQACFDNKTIGDELDAKGFSWRFYAGKLVGDGGYWSAYQAIKHIRFGTDWKKDVISPQTRFFADIRGGYLAAVTWITPTCGNSDHSACNSSTGPAWVASLVNAIGGSAFWDSTAIFVLWDEWGGWYDHVAPQYLDYDGLGFRVPLLVISPYAKKGYVSHVQYEHGSILRFIEDQFGLKRLAASDARATSPDHDSFDFSHPPRKFTPIATNRRAADFIRAPLDLRRPDDR